ncbi:hypothetical protein K439DRAFT_919763 [Ramaria rubella]|nr:hypothetical protein K439DRAFT_919763 [Ramaria rubella]
MEDIIPESNARGGLSTSQTFEPLHMPVEPPPRPVEPRIPTIVSDPRPGNRLPPLLRSRSRSPSSLFPALMRQDDDSSDATHSPTIPTPAQQPRHAWHSRYRGARLDDGLVAERYLSHETTGYRHGSRGSLSRAPRSNSGVIFTPETFSELVRRRAARADARARADAQMRDATLSPSPETMSRAIHGPFRASQRFEERDAARHLERDARRDMHRNTDAPGLSSIFGRNAADQSSSMQRDRDLVRRELHAAGALDRSAGPRYTPDRSNSYLASMLADHERSGTFSRPQSSIPLHSEDEAGPIDRTTIERQRLPFAMGLPNMSSPFAHSSESDENIGSGSRDREQLREAISRRSRDDEDSRRPLSRLGRTRSVNSRDLMLDETTQILQRRLRESEVDPSRALRALDQWGELEGAGERDLGPSQSHIHRFGETMRQRRVPPAFAFGSMAMSDNSVSGASSSNSREVRRSPSPPGSTAVARLQARQASNGI